MVLGILVKTSGSQRSLCVRAPRQEVRTAVREIAEVPWWWRYILPESPKKVAETFLLRGRTGGGNLLESSVGGSGVATEIGLESTPEYQSFAPGSGTWSKTDLRFSDCVHPALARVGQPPLSLQTYAASAVSKMTKQSLSNIKSSSKVFPSGSDILRLWTLLLYINDLFVPSMR